MIQNVLLDLPSSKVYLYSHNKEKKASIILMTSALYIFIYIYIYGNVYKYIYNYVDIYINTYWFIFL